MHLKYSFLALISIICAGSASLFGEITLLTADTDGCNCAGTIDAGKDGDSYICGDKRLGPKHLPESFPLLSFVSDYNRFGGQEPGVFLSKWTWPHGSKCIGKPYKNGYYCFPPYNGFQLSVDNKPIVENMTLLPGTIVDRFGAESGTYVSAADAPYAQRSLPPQNLDTPIEKPDYPYDYHIYTVMKPLRCEGGPIAPWYDQPGLGAQFYVGHIGNISDLVKWGYLERANISEIQPGPGRRRGCGL